jgi:hypothetical protein
MVDFLKSGQVGNIELNEQRKMRTEIANRWDNLGMTEGLVGVVKENIATLYENTAKMMLSEASDASNSGSFETVVFPIIRRVFSKLLANDIVSVQAMNLPIGKLFYLLPVTSEREWSSEEIEDGTTGRHRGLMGYERTDRRDGSTYNRFYLPDEVVNDQVFETYDVKSGEVVASGFTSYDEAFATLEEGQRVRQVSPEVTKYMGKTLYDLFYNDFLFDNSKGKIHIKVGEATPVVFKRGQLVDATAEDLKLYSDGTLRNIILKVKGFASYNPGKLTGPDGNEMDTEAFLGSLKVVAKEKLGSESGTCFAVNEGIPFRVVTQKYGKGIVEYAGACDAEGCIYLDVDLAKPARVQGASIDGYLGIEMPESIEDLFQVAWCQYDSLELETEIGEVSFKLDSVVVSVEERKLRATWSPELAQDVSAFHNIDAEAELTALLSEQIAAEIDREIIRDLRKLAPWQQRWDVNGWRRMAGFSTNYTQKDWNQELVTKVNQISAQIHKSTLRGGANFLVVSSEISAVFDNLEYFHVSDASAESDQYNMGIERIGSLGGRYQVYRDPYSPSWSIIIGHRGKSLLDTGYIYAPYIPMQLTPVIYNPHNFAPVKGIITRYAKKCVNNRYYGAVRVDGLTTWDINELR